MKSLLIVIMVLAVFIPAVQAELTYLPESSYYNGKHDKTFNLDSGETLKIHLEFAVYNSEGEDEAAILRNITNYEGNATGFVYAYQVFCAETSSSTAALTYFSLTGVDPDAIDSVTNDIGQRDSLATPGGTFDSQGIEPNGDGGYFNGDVTEAIWEFDDGMMVEGTNSWFLFLYSDSDWVKGDMEIQSAYSDDIPVPDGEDDETVPEPATLILLAGGALLLTKSQRKKF